MIISYHHCENKIPKKIMIKMLAMIFLFFVLHQRLLVCYENYMVVRVKQHFLGVVMFSSYFSFRLFCYRI